LQELKIYKNRLARVELKFSERLKALPQKESENNIISVDCGDQSEKLPVNLIFIVFI
jgi:hypothetical protein